MAPLAPVTKTRRGVGGDIEPISLGMGVTGAPRGEAVYSNAKNPLVKGAETGLCRSGDIYCLGRGHARRLKGKDGEHGNRCQRLAAAYPGVRLMGNLNKSELPAPAALLDLSGQVALVTGASRGIGRAIAEVLARSGAAVALVSRSATALEEVAREIEGNGGRALAIAADVAREEDVEVAVAHVLKVFGRLDILVNNAGLINFGPLEKIGPEAWDAVLGANLTGPYRCCRAAAPAMRRQGYGRIVNITSVSAQTGGVSGGVDYAASKGGLASMTKTLARDLAANGVTVNAVAPGQIDADPELLTAEQRKKVTAMIPLGRLGTPEEIAYAVLFLVSPMAAYITGATLDVNGGILKR